MSEEPKKEDTVHDLRYRLQKFEIREHTMTKLFPWLESEYVPTPEQTYDLVRWLKKHVIYKEVT